MTITIEQLENMIADHIEEHGDSPFEEMSVDGSKLDITLAESFEKKLDGVTNIEEVVEQLVTRALERVTQNTETDEAASPKGE